MKTQDFDGFVAAVRAMADPAPGGDRADAPGSTPATRAPLPRVDRPRAECLEPAVAAVGGGHPCRIRLDAPSRAGPGARGLEVRLDPGPIRARNAAPSAAPSGTATVSTGSAVASATACIHAVERDPPPVATIRRARTPDSSTSLRMTKPDASWEARTTSSGPWAMSSPCRLAWSRGSWNGVRSPRR